MRWMREQDELVRTGAPPSALASALGRSRQAVCARRIALGISCRRFGAAHRTALSEALRRRVEREGVASLVDLRWRLYYAASRRVSGWRADLKGLQLRIMGALWECGPMTRLELAEALALRADGVRPCHWFAGHGKRCLLGELCRRGLVEKVGRVRRAPGRGLGGTETVYALPLWIERDDPQN